MPAAQTSGQLNLHLSERFPLPQPLTNESLKPLPGSPAVFVLVDQADQPILLASTQNLRGGAEAKLLTPDDASRPHADLAAIAAAVRYREVSCRFEADWVYCQLARQLYPREYRQMISFGPAWFLALTAQRDVHEIRVSDRLGSRGPAVGPFRTQRSAQHTLELLWDLFDLCRYPEQVRVAPGGRRCAYADMGRCDAPCDGSAPLPAYNERVNAAWEFLFAGSVAWAAAATQRMRAAALAQQYEQAALLKRQLDTAARWDTEHRETLRRADDWQLVIGLRATRRQAARLMYFHHFELVEGPLLPLRRFAGPAAEWLEAMLAMQPPVTQPPDEALWLVSHLLLGPPAEKQAVVLPVRGTSAALAEQLAAELAALKPAKLAGQPPTVSSDAEPRGTD